MGNYSGAYYALLDNTEELIRSYQSMSAFSNFLRLAILVLTAIGLWNMYIKAGEPGWAALIPFYRTYVLYKISDMKKLFWLNLGCIVASLVVLVITLVSFWTMFINSLAGAYSNNYDALMGMLGGLMVAWLILFICGIISLVLRVINVIKLAGVFNLNGGYAVGLFFLPAIFYMILGLSKNIYYKNRRPGMNGFNGQSGYAGDPYANNYAQNPYQQNYYQQNNYQQNTYQQAPYQQNNYQQNTYQQAPYQQNNYQQNTYQQAPYQQNTYQQNPYAQNPYMQNDYARNNNSQDAQAKYDSYQSSQTAQGRAQNPYASPDRQEVWNTIYDDDKNNLN